MTLGKAHRKQVHISHLLKKENKSKSECLDDKFIWPKTDDCLMDQYSRIMKMRNTAQMLVCFYYIY